MTIRYLIEKIYHPHYVMVCCAAMSKSMCFE